MIKVTGDGKKWLDRQFGNKGVRDLHIKLSGGKCGMGCLECRACKGQMKVLAEGAQPGDALFSASDYRFSVDSDLIARADAIRVDACGSIPMVRSEKAVL